MSPIPFTAPIAAYEVGSTSMVVQLPASTTMARVSVLTAVPEPPALVADLVSGLGRGLPLDRPEEMLRLAEEVLAAGPSGFPEDWARTLAEESSRFDD